MKPIYAIEVFKISLRINCGLPEKKCGSSYEGKSIVLDCWFKLWA
jgi:hypothetical protein